VAEEEEEEEEEEDLFWKTKIHASHAPSRPARVMCKKICLSGIS
jgi:hypothetical protein